MNGQIWRPDWAAGLVLVISSGVLLPGLMMFWFRGGQKGGAPRSPAHYTLERAFIAAWVILTAVGYTLLLGSFPGGPGQTLAVAGVAAYVLVCVLLAAAELLIPTLGYDKVYRLVAGYVIVAFLAQALIGVALLLTGFVPAWIGWASIAWNIGWLVVLPLASPRDIYFPVLHSIAPLLVGIALLLR